ncbi:MAG: DUF1028 domain-containing protein [Deferribacteres bacterium]|nr:DUF1028 domain-containing protein [candidate division KSB1 bacterium]MCB9500742.1 DUF1028 domain-containing protein [Deferribacteres bacterium]
MKTLKLIVLCSVLLSFLVFDASGGEKLRPVATYSIVARDSITGQLGVAVQSNWFSVGSIVSWAESGVGAVATQSFVEPSYGPLGLDLMRAGKSAQQTLSALLQADDYTDVRQVAMVDANGNVKAHTGSNCIVYANHVTGAGFSCQANMMEKSTVPAAMAKAYSAAKGDLAERLMVALEAAQAEGGDIRGKQSAALVVVSGERSGTPWNNRIYDVRIEDHKTPLVEMRRLLHVSRVYQHANHGDELMTENKVAEAMEEYTKAMELAPDNMEMVFWPAVTLASVDKIDQAMPLFKKVFAKEERWKELLKRLPAAGLISQEAVDEVLKRIK